MCDYDENYMLNKQIKTGVDVVKIQEIICFIQLLNFIWLINKD